MTFNAWLRWDVIERLLPENGRLLEIGPGVGSISNRLVRRFNYVGVELSRSSAVATRDRVRALGGRVVNGSVECIDAEFDVLCAFEVLEHIEDDVRAIRTWARCLQDDGRLLLTVPADPGLFGANDDLAGHYRRYTPEALRDVLVDGGMRVERMETIGGPAGYLLKWARDQRAKRIDVLDKPKCYKTLASGRIRQPGRLMGAATWALMLPCRWLQRPFASTRLGTGLAAAASRA